MFFILSSTHYNLVVLLIQSLEITSSLVRSLRTPYVNDRGETTYLATNETYRQLINYNSRKRQAISSSFLISREQCSLVPWSSISKIRSNVISLIDSLYRECIQVGEVRKFYESDVTNCHTPNEFKLRSESLLKTLKQSKKKKISISIPPFVKFSSSCCSKNTGPSHKDLKFLQNEKTIEMEYRMRNVFIHVCDCCKIYYLEENRSLTSHKKEICESCKKSKHTSEWWLEQNLLPVWYKTLSTGESDLSNPQWHIPSELNDLTMAEKLLIRRVAVFVPAIHINRSSIGIEGHCICFPQDIGEICNELPNKKTTILKFIRDIGKGPLKDTISRTYLKVNRKKVLEALRWLQKYHVGYHDVEIVEDHLSWMNGEEEREIEVTIHRTNEDDKDKTQVFEPVSISQNQLSSITENASELNFTSVYESKKFFRPSITQKENVTSLHESIIASQHEEQLLQFPSIDTSNPLR